MDQDQDNYIYFLGWLINRLIFKHQYADNDQVIINLKATINKLKNPSIEISEEDLDKIITKYYADFFLEKDSFTNLGYSETERIKIRSDIKNLIVDVVTKNIPKEQFIKG